MPPAEINTDTPKDLVTAQATSPAEVESWVVPTTGLVDKLASSPMPPNQVGGEKQCVLMVTTSVGRLNIEATRVTSVDTMFASVEGVAFGNPCMVASLSGPPKERRQSGHWDATAGELAEGDLAEDQL